MPTEAAYTVGRLAMRLREGRNWDLLFMPMVKLVSEVGMVISAGISGIGGCCISWKCRLRRPNVRSARSGRAGLSLSRRCRMNGSWSAVSMGSIDLMLSMRERRVTWSKWDGIGVGAYLLMDLEGCPTAKLLSVEYVGGGDCSKTLKCFGQK